MIAGRSGAATAAAPAAASIPNNCRLLAFHLRSFSSLFTGRATSMLWM
jgi:hypothetical protein